MWIGAYFASVQFKCVPGCSIHLSPPQSITRTIPPPVNYNTKVKYSRLAVRKPCSSRSCRPRTWIQPSETACICPSSTLQLVNSSSTLVHLARSDHPWFRDSTGYKMFLTNCLENSQLTHCLVLYCYLLFPFVKCSSVVCLKFFVTSSILI